MARGCSISSTFLRDRNVCLYAYTWPTVVAQVVQNSPTSRKLIAMVELIPRLKMASHVAAARYFEEVRYSASKGGFLVDIIINFCGCSFIFHYIRS